ncbi:C45 family autoproteolytic acyltransferase/hydolase [Peterkaempfera bronchialis]|uniref:Peptidase C45 n=1 Tax=Peterkaempfera bronchialis TaxID=2126346 RepID=A0A345T4P4_9ACTN|nr:C45 family peptidase [Peterkaempfera bronchialis]AXI80949.1 peptidase C45 [Peterkaempfera bronchialis]
MTTPTVFRSAKAAPGDRGQQLGRAFPEPIRHAATFYDQLFAATGAAPQEVTDWGLRAFEHIAAWAPELAEEMDGIARGAGLPLWRIAALNARTEILGRFGRIQQPECSTAVYTPADGRPPVTAQTWDWHDGMRDGWFVWTIEHPDGRVVHTVTEYGIVGKIGVNTAGLGLHFNILGHTSDKSAEPAESWIPVHVLARRMLDTCADVPQAAALATRTPVAASSSLTLADHAAGRAGAVAVELSPAGSVLLRPRDDGYLLRTNHFVDPALATGEVIGAEDKGTYDRMDVLQERTAALGEPDRAALIKALTCHLDEGAEICSHPQPDAALGTRWETLATVSLDIVRGGLAVHRGGPCTADRESWVDVA